MCHALILDDNMIIGRAVQDRLASLGFDSFDHAWTVDQAVESAAHRLPDLVVVGETIVGGSPLGAAQRISAERDAPVLMIAADRCRVQRRPADGAAVNGPFPLSEIESALAVACPA